MPTVQPTFGARTAHECHNQPGGTTSRPIRIIGVPLDLGSGRRGVDMGPSAIRIAGLGERLMALECDVTDRGDVAAPIPEARTPREPTKKFIREIARVCRRLY